MNRKEHLLTILGEECAEVAQRCSKALRFGLGEIQPGQELNNAQRIRQELCDLIAVMEMMVAEDMITLIHWRDTPAIDEKKAKVEKFLVYSAEQGCLQPDNTPL